MTNATDAETRIRDFVNEPVIITTGSGFMPSDADMREAEQMHESCFLGVKRSDLRSLLASLATLREENEQLAIGARGAIQVAAMMLVKLGGSATFTALEQVAIQGTVTRTDGPMGEYTLTLDAARSGATP